MAPPTVALDHSEEDQLSLKAPLPACSLPAVRSSSPASPASGTAGQTHAPCASAPVLGLLSSLPGDASVAQGLFEKASVRTRDMLAAARPWREYFDAHEIVVPKFSQITERFEANVHIFRGNYEIIALAWVAFGLFMSLGSFLIAGILLICVERWARFKVEKEGGLDFTEKALACAAVLTIVWMTGVGKNVVEAFALAAASVALHAVLRVPPETDIEIGEMEPTV